MKQAGKIRWMQLSDLHFKGADGQWMLNDDIGEIKNIDFLTIVGDLRQFGTTYDETEKFLEKLTEKLGIGADDVFLVPGNHDVSSEENKDRDNALGEIKDNIWNNDSYYKNYTDCLKGAYGRFSDFYKRFFGVKRNIPLGASLEKWGEIQLLLINTSLICSGGQNEQLILDKSALDKLAGEINSDKPLLVLAHHSAYSLYQTHLEYLKSYLGRVNANHIMVGHTHRQAKDTLTLDSGETVYMMTSPKGTLENGDNWSRTGVIIYECDTSTSDWDTTVSYYEWNGSRLQPSFSLHGKDNDGNLTPVHFPLKPIERVTDATRYAERLSYDVPGRSTENFVHRNNELRDVSEKLKNGKSVALRGIGGIGKTSVASALYFELEKSFKKIAWIQYETDLKTSLLANIRPPFETEDSNLKYDAIKNMLSNLHGDALIVTDNLGKLEKDERDFLSSLKAVRLATSRLSEKLLRGYNFEPYDIELMSEDECVYMFYGYYTDDENRDHEATVRKIVRLAGRHTLLVELLARSLSVLFDTPEEFLKKLTEKGFDCSDAMVESGADGEEKTISGHLVKLYDINCFGDSEKSVLRCFSALPSSPVPNSVMKLTGFDVNIIDRLVSLGWLSRTTDGYMMYDIVRESVIRQGGAAWDDIAPIAKAVCDDGYIDSSEAHEISYPKYMIACDAARFALSLAEYPDDAVYLLNCAGIYADDMGEYDEALEYYNRALKIYKAVLGEDHTDTAMSYNNIGNVYTRMGEYGKALEYYNRALKIREAVLGENHPNTATSYNNIGNVYTRMGEYDKALEFHNKALKIYKAVLGEDHTDTAASYNNIGTLYDDMGKYDEALEFYNKALKIREAVLGKDHPDTAMPYNNIGNVYYNTGEYDTALEFYNRALKIFKAVLGEDHTDTAASYNNIGAVYNGMGKYDEALKFFNKALKIREAVLSEDHPDTAASYNNIGAVYARMGKYDEALEYYNRALKIYKAVLGENHPDTAMSYNNVGNVYYNTGEYDTALEFYNRALKIFKERLGENHPHTKQVQESIDNLKKADAEKDLTSNEQEPDIAETPSEEAHPDISEQCGVIESADNYKNALARCEDELRSAESRFGGNSHEAAKAYDKTGDFYLENGKLDEALEYYETAYGIFKKIHGESHSDTERVREKIENLEAAE